MDASTKFFLLTNIPGIVDIIIKFRKDRNWHRLAQETQLLFDIFSKGYMLESNQYMLLALFEFTKIVGKLLKSASAPKHPLYTKLVPFTPKMLRLLRPFVYLIMVSTLGRNSWKALGVCGTIDLFADKVIWWKYALRSPVFDKFTIRLVLKLPGIRMLAELAKTYQAYISYSL